MCKFCHNSRTRQKTRSFLLFKVTECHNRNIRRTWRNNSQSCKPHTYLDTKYRKFGRRLDRYVIRLRQSVSISYPKFIDSGFKTVHGLARDNGTKEQVSEVYKFQHPRYT